MAQRIDFTFPIIMAGKTVAEAEGFCEAFLTDDEGIDFAGIVMEHYDAPLGTPRSSSRRLVSLEPGTPDYNAVHAYLLTHYVSHDLAWAIRESDVGSYADYRTSMRDAAE